MYSRLGKKRGRERMREIKFRVWADDKFYDKCLVGNTNNTNDEKWTCPMVWLEDRKEWVHCDNGDICQYTGLKDKNGTEIYEGDMLDYDGDLWQVEYLEEDGMFALISEGIVENFSNMNSKWFEVIGNIHENPELLEVKDE